ncbi:hypothetical protein TNCV_5038451 [Trichonephila clavipes]|nr:hypothetical protein TNCV_5038451 [Trichonephila clavipes]
MKASLPSIMFTITVQHMDYENQPTLLYHPLAIEEDNLPDSKLSLVENGRGESDFQLTLFKQSNDSHLHDEQQLLYLTRAYPPQLSRLFLLSLDCVQLSVYPHLV